jgi:hypothetical protein
MADIDDIKQLQEEFKKINEQVRAINGSFYEEIPTNINALKNGIKFLKEELKSINDIAGSLSSSLRDSISELSKGDTNTKRIIGSFKSLESIASKFKYDMLDYQTMSKKDIQNNISKIKQNKDLLQDILDRKQIEEDVRKLGLDSEEAISAEIARRRNETEGVIEQSEKLLDYAKERLEEEKKIQKQLGLTGIAAKGLVNTLSKFGIDSSYFSDLDEKLRDTAKNNGDVFVTLGKEIKTNLSDALKDPLVQFAVGLKLVKSSFNDIKKAFDIFLEYNKIFVETARNLGMTTDQITNLISKANFAGEAFQENVYTTAQLTKAITESNAQLGLSVDLGKDTTREFAAMTNQMGLSADEAAKIYKLGTLNNMSLKDTNKAISAGIIYAQKQTGVQINARQVFQEIGKLSAGITAKFQQNPEALAKAVAQAKALGTNLEQVEKVGESLLNFESSIENELKAELLTGKQINLEKARYAALTGDQATLTQELADQVGSLAEFQEMNVLAQKSLAEAFGLSRDEVADMLTKQETFNKLGDISKKSAAEQLAIARERGLSEEDSLVKNLQQQAAAEKMEATFDRLKSTLAGIVDGPLGDIVNFMAKLLQNSYAVYGILGVALAGSIVKLVLGFGQLIKVARIFKALEIGSAIASAAKAAFSSPLAMVTGGLAGLGVLGVLTGAIMAATNVQNVEDGMAPASKGPFTITDAYGSTAVTAAGDGVVVSPNINRDSINRPAQPSFNTSAITDAIATLSDTVSSLVNRAQPTPQFALTVDGKQLGTIVGKQMETGTSQLMGTSYELA